jgi:hypothetical protein
MKNRFDDLPQSRASLRLAQKWTTTFRDTPGFIPVPKEYEKEPEESKKKLPFLVAFPL